MRRWLGRSDPPFLPSRQRHPAESAWLPSRPSRAAVSQVSPKYSFQGNLVLFWLWPSRPHACPQRLFFPARPASISPAELWSIPSARPQPPGQLPRAGPPPWGREGSVRGTLRWWPPKERGCLGRQLEASGATAVSRRGLPEERGGPSVAFPPRCGPVPAKEPRAGSPQGLSQVGQGPWTASARSPLAPLPAPRGLWGLGAGPAGAAERDEGRFLKLYFSAGSFRVNELTS